MNKKLFDIISENQEHSKNLENLLDFLETEQGKELPANEVKDVLNHAFDEAEKNEAFLKDKVNGYCWYIDSLKKEEELIDERIKALTARKKSTENKREFVKENLSYNLKRLNIEKYETADYKIGFRQQPEKVHIIDASKSVPNEYLKTKTETTIDLKTLLKDLKNGVVVENAKIIREDVKINIR